MTLSAILSDLLNENVASAIQMGPAISQSNFGLPLEDHPAGFLKYVEQFLPDVEPAEIFGFNWNI